MAWPEADVIGEHSASVLGCGSPVQSPPEPLWDITRCTVNEDKQDLLQKHSPDPYTNTDILLHVAFHCTNN